MAYQLPTNKYSVVIYGYVIPLVVVFTIFSNTLTCIVLLKKHMRNPTNIILFSMALLNMFSGILIMPTDIYYYTFGQYKEYVPYNLCLVILFGQYTVPGIFHTASVWLTVVLVLHRYICVCHPQVAKRWCTIPNTIKCILVICTLAIPINTVNYIAIKFTALEIPSLLDPTKNITGCIILLKRGDALHITDKWLQVIFQVLIPCFSLLILNSQLIKIIRRAARRRWMLVSLNRTMERSNLSESNRTTMLLVMVVGLFLTAGLPAGVLHIIQIVQYTFNVDILTSNTLVVAFTFINLCSFLSFPFNLVIYCGMSRQFRETFKNLFK